MLRLFKQNNLLQGCVLLIVVLLLWARQLGHPVSMPTAVGYAPLYGLVHSLSLSALVATLIAIALILFGSFSINQILSRAGLVPQNNLLPAYLYTLFMSATATTLTPTLLASMLLLPIMSLLLLRGTLLTVSTDKIFGVASLISIASMLYLPMITLLIAYLLVVINYRLYSWRDWVVLLLGLLAPYILLWSYHFANGTLSQQLIAMGDSLSQIALTTNTTSTLHAVCNLLLLAIAIWSIFRLWGHLGEHPVAWQKNAITTMLPAVSGLVMLLYSSLIPANLQFFAVPFALCGTWLFLSSQQHRYGRSRGWRPWVYNSLLILILIAGAIC